MHCKCLPGVMPAAVRDEWIRGLIAAVNFLQRHFDRRIHSCGHVFFSHHSEWSDAVPKTFCEILFIPLNT